MKGWVRSAAAIASLAALPLVLWAQGMDMSPGHSLHHGGAPKPAGEAFVPGLGEIMSAQQMRHAKLWFAGSAGNWPLAAYEVSELKEGFDQAVAQHPTHEGANVAKLVPALVMPPLAELEMAIQAGQSADFAERFDRLTAACNACHKAAQHPFIVIQRPTLQTYTNQVFEPAKR